MYNLPRGNLSPFPLVTSLAPWEKGLTPTSPQHPFICSPPSNLLPSLQPPYPPRSMWLKCQQDAPSSLATLPSHPNATFLPSAGIFLPGVCVTPLSTPQELSKTCPLMNGSDAGSQDSTWILPNLPSKCTWTATTPASKSPHSCIPL